MVYFIQRLVHWVNGCWPSDEGMKAALAADVTVTSAVSTVRTLLGARHLCEAGIESAPTKPAHQAATRTSA